MVLTAVGIILQIARPEHYWRRLGRILLMPLLLAIGANLVRGFWTQASPANRLLAIAVVIGLFLAGIFNFRSVRKVGGTALLSWLLSRKIDNAKGGPH